jgi:hypothetical protein
MDTPYCIKVRLVLIIHVSTHCSNWIRDIRSSQCEIDKTLDQLPIYSYIIQFLSLIFLRAHIRIHRSRNSLAAKHPITLQ